MTIEAPNLDDRNFAQLLHEADQIILQKTPTWTDTTPSDPGRVLLELFAYLTELMIYRLNRVPEKAYLEYLRLIGLSVRPPAAAAVELEFQSDKPATAPIPIPRGVRVSLNRVSGGTEAPVFTTDDPASIEVGQQSVAVLAHHCDFIEGELLGMGTGQPAQSVVVGRAPVIAPTGNELDLVVGVEARPDELTERVPARDYDGRPFRSFFTPASVIFVPDTTTISSRSSFSRTSTEASVTGVESRFRYVSSGNEARLVSPASSTSVHSRLNHFSFLDSRRWVRPLPSILAPPRFRVSRSGNPSS